MGVSPSSLAKVIAVADPPKKDIHTGNILFRVPELESLSPEDITNKFEQPRIGKVARHGGQPSEDGVPDYLVEPIEFRAQFIRGFCEVQLIDFGECKLVDLC